MPKGLGTSGSPAVGSIYRGVPGLAPPPLVPGNNQNCPSQQSKFQSGNRAVIPFSEYNQAGLVIPNQIVSARGKSIGMLGGPQSNPAAGNISDAMFFVHFTPFSSADYINAAILNFGTGGAENVLVPPSDLTITNEGALWVTFECEFDFFYFTVVNKYGGLTEGSDVLIVSRPRDASFLYKF